MTVLQKVQQDILEMRRKVIYAAEKEECVICGDLDELRYGCCFTCGQVTAFSDPRVRRDRPIGPPDPDVRGEEN